MRFLVDNQLPKILAEWLSQQGHAAEHVLDVGLGQAKDLQIWRYAQQNNAVVVTKDEDFAQWVRRARPGPTVVWLRLGNSSRRTLLSWLEPLLPAIVRHVEQGDRLIEVR